jgi:lysophosphatidylcholine acyltransferase/lyso-PAF acetyltransferase
MDDSFEKEDIFDLDPFHHHLHMSVTDWIKTILFGMFLIPFRIVIMLLFAIIMHIISSTALILTSNVVDDKKEDATRVPGFGSRMAIRLITLLGRLCFRIIGFRVMIKGNIATQKQAPILVFAPHSTFFDFLISFWCCTFTYPFVSPPYAVSAIENTDIPFMGNLLKLIGSINVCREDSNSRKKTIKEINRRSKLTEGNSSSQWPQLIISPEGHHSNRKAILPFKLGAFYPGKPIQPIIVSYPNQIDTVTWTLKQNHGAIAVLFVTLAQWRTNVQLEFLPVYNPKSHEVENPTLYAKFVRNIMARALETPLSDVDFSEAKKEFAKPSDNRPTLHRKGLYQ